ncbi:AraC family transcriptional regulator [Amycolatopsis mediterranei S699]|uniref:AraC family transcriptional regulator n=2 Tax=Amycolatopsis mediterranei TaxID=33910 RepID=A0A0H3DER4_AMYMU|nr:AraC family transcriptional regulator [Amycolatopsis mediterranei]ADJ49405.1 AraC family transcriptional regulator [Amycolatopsis mediterranei U32]AEK46376.1 AraC family transcriptional regulator [Amycolatopsis mediterranei S699]AFO81113.1 AraC family transcriptional regulator [Amycolatopsis mediterranei S699]AGT88241.1 AraC family transcriptional regulator [Amycolatopsis mediterranei RB]KDO09339.1 AraC family transcriptional regulator [Amycolatopsis mediterranei]
MLEQLRDLITRHAHADLRTPVPGLLLSKVETSEPHHSLAEPLLVVMAQGGKRLLLGDHVHEYRAGQYLLVGTDLPVTGHFVGATPRTPALGLGLALRPTAIAPLLLEAPPRTPPASPIAIDDAGPELLDAALRLLRLLDHPSDAPVLAPLIEREILWRLLTGPHGGLVRRIGLADSGAAHVGRAIRWIRANYAEPMRIEELARLSGLSASAFHRQFRAVTAMSPLQFQKRIRLQEARSLLLADAGDVAGVGHLVGYDSPSQFNREYRRLFGAPPGQDAARLREAPSVGPRLP